MARNQTEYPDLEKLLAKWQPILRLMDWDISVGYYRAYEMPENGVGACNVCVERNSAEIRVLHPCDLQPDSTDNTKSVELTLIHELRHIPYHFFKPEQGTLAYAMWERSVDMDSVILAGLETKKRKK
jgi:hypothetical protein